ncbi:MAG: hypothetical protein PHV87_06520 [Bacilli bacterium]|nr:hypothetical protein [Bacilli bacterium]
MKNRKKAEKKPLIKTKVKRDNAIEIEIQKTPDKTVVGKIIILILVFGMSLLMLVSLIILIIQIAGKI